MHRILGRSLRKSHEKRHAQSRRRDRMSFRMRAPLILRVLEKFVSACACSPLAPPCGVHWVSSTHRLRPFVCWAMQWGVNIRCCLGKKRKTIQKHLRQFAGVCAHRTAKRNGMIFHFPRKREASDTAPLFRSHDLLRKVLWTPRSQRRACGRPFL